MSFDSWNIYEKDNRPKEGQVFWMTDCEGLELCMMTDNLIEVLLVVKENKYAGEYWIPVKIPVVEFSGGDFLNE